MCVIKYYDELIEFGHNNVDQHTMSPFGKEDVGTPYIEFKVVDMVSLTM